jgi:hypothetical protein
MNMAAPVMKMNPNKKYLGRWRILEMELWDKDFIDLTGEGHITFDKKNRGELQFGAVACDLDCRIGKAGDQERIEFSFVGMDEGDEISGRGWAVLQGAGLRGRIYFHDGDESGFIAAKS